MREAVSKYLRRLTNTPEHVCPRNFRHCTKCQKYVLVEGFESHDRQMKVCSKCHRAWPVDEIDNHVCTTLHCTLCYFTYPPSDFATHTCERRRCPTCHTYQVEGHVCDQKNCPTCQKVFPSSEFEGHKCERRFCSRCRRWILLSEFEGHVCDQLHCRGKILSAQHGPARAPRGAQRNAALETLIRRLLEHQETSKFPILPEWRIQRQLYEEKSPKLYFYDLETWRSTKPGRHYRWVFSICMRDAARKTIMHTKISQGMTISQLYDASDKIGWEREVLKWYGERSDDVTPGMQFRRDREAKYHLLSYF